ncbi:hypothetical protein [Sphaerimonospora thailandensis]|uniref:Uncharacterized protein n=1 Tax=Sphaerimonospora thailandensis TaxID=795644 RepID=A0A8J3RBC0_9ACTN|nr:hypothetical protein [Sphaerimonospora thailandensis]GIH71549.1 hypothetical protein Mth01_38020 [Sphaerimonospora thailandensis]
MAEDLRETAPYSEDMGMLTVELDVKAEKALGELTSDGRSASEAVREALLIAQRLRRMEQAQVAAERLANDPADRAEAEAIMRDTEHLRAW